MKWWQRHHLWRLVPRQFREKFHDLVQCPAEMPTVSMGDGWFTPFCVRYRWHLGDHQSSLVMVESDDE